MEIRLECFAVAILALMMCAQLFFDTIPRITTRKDCNNASIRKQLLFVKILIIVLFLAGLFSIILGIFIFML